MSEFSFEIVRQRDTSVIAHVLRLTDERAIWCQVEALALRIQTSGCAYIRVKNSEGEIVVRAGVATAVASIERCPYLVCPLKRELARRVSTASLCAVAQTWNRRCPASPPSNRSNRYRDLGDAMAGVQIVRSKLSDTFTVL